MTASRVLRDQYVAASFKDRRSTLAGELRQLEQTAQLKAEALAHLDAVLLGSAPEIDAKALPVRVSSGQPLQGDGHLATYPGVLRRWGEPMAAAEVVAAIMTEIAFPAEAHAVVAHAVGYALRNLELTKSSIKKDGERYDAARSLV